MRDLLAMALVFGSLPRCFRDPFFGLLVFTWLAYMRIQDLCWGFARDFRFSYIVGLATILGFLANERRRPFFRPDLRTWTMILLGLLTGVSVLAGYRQDAFVWTRYLEFLKILLVALLTTGLVDSRRRLFLLTATIALSLGFFGFKGGLAGFLSGGSPILRGPGGMMEDNNDFALALVMAIPLLYYLGIAENRAWLRRGLLAAAFLTVITIVLTHSRGGFLALAVTLGVIAWRSRRRYAAFAIGAAAILLFLVAAPVSVKERLATISRYEEDSSAVGRLVAWRAAWRLALLHPLLGVGMRSFEEAWVGKPEIWGSDALPPPGGRVAHNSYLQILAETGFPAFLAYLALLFSTIWLLRRLRLQVRRGRAPDWVDAYVRMFEASLAGFLVGAVFLNRAHFDLAYQMVAIVSALAWIAARDPAAAGAGGGAPDLDEPAPRAGGLEWPAAAPVPARFRSG